jgi:hypothetical protein
MQISTPNLKINNSAEGVSAPHSKNQFIKHGGACEHCGREILPARLRGKIVGRARRFCSNRCRQASFRNAEFERQYQPPQALQNDKNNSIVSDACNDDFAGRASPEVWRKVLKAEQPWREGGQAITSPDGVQCFVAGRLRRPR